MPKTISFINVHFAKLCIFHRAVFLDTGTDVPAQGGSPGMEHFILPDFIRNLDHIIQHHGRIHIGWNIIAIGTGVIAAAEATPCHTGVSYRCSQTTTGQRLCLTGGIAFKPIA